MKPRYLRLLLSMIGVVGFSLIALLSLSGNFQAPSFSKIKAEYRPSEAWLLDRNGEVIAVKRIDNTVRRLEWLQLSDISSASQELLILSEDKRFFEHGGVDWLALVSSSASSLMHVFDGKRSRGASTLTMQLAGFLDPSLAPARSRRTLTQKWRQIRAAQEIEKNWSKPEILEAYFNLASFRGEIVGIHAASFALYGVHPSSLNREQSLLLMALLKGPMAKPTQAAKRACALLNATQRDDVSSCESLHVLAQAALNTQGYVIPQNSIAPHLAQKLLTQPGSRVSTTLDANLQRFAIQSLREHLMSINTQNASDGAVVVIDNHSGDVLAYVGSSAELSDASKVDGVTSLRQAGSTLKPFLYGSAIEEKRLTAASVLEDTPIQLTTPMGLYIPQNYDRDFKGSVSVRTALASSLNVPAVRALGLIGVDKFTRILRAYGLDSLTQDGDHYGFSLALGGVDVRLIDLTNAYRALANRGVWHRVRYRSTEKKQPGKKVLSKQAAFIIADILADRGARALTFGLENPLATRVWTAAKTGTSKDMRDNWCIGFSSRYTVGVWVGNFNGEPMRDVSGVSGAAPVWRDMMDYLHMGSVSPSPKIPRGVVTQSMHFVPAIESARTEFFVEGTEVEEIRLVDKGTSHEIRAKILYPPEGTLIAMDPDIPSKYQRMQFSSQGNQEVTWFMDDVNVGTGSDIGWTPSGGKHRLQLQDSQGNELDSITFEVRGAN